MFVRRIGVALVVGITLLTAAAGQGQEYLTGIKWPEPPIVAPGKTDADPPSDAVVLFGGKDLSAWHNGEKWKIEDGVAIVRGGDITTKESFGDCQLHIEWSSPVPARGRSQERGNSGVFLMDRYEMQVLDSYDNETYFDGQAAGIYKQTPPMVNAMRPPGEWNTYDIIWTAPKFKEDASLESPAYITALHNGILVLHHFALLGNTPFNQPPKYEQHGKLPIHLQDHGNPVRYRNIWVREIKPIVGERVREPYFRDGEREWPVDQKTSAAVGRTNSGVSLRPAGITVSGIEPPMFELAPMVDGKFYPEIRPIRMRTSIELRNWPMLKSPPANHQANGARKPSE
jgi:hypothetical protein